jgi:hypothetical protein
VLDRRDAGGEEFEQLDWAAAAGQRGVACRGPAYGRGNGLARPRVRLARQSRPPGSSARGTSAKSSGVVGAQEVEHVGGDEAVEAASVESAVCGQPREQAGGEPAGSAAELEYGTRLLEFARVQ